MAAAASSTLACAASSDSRAAVTYAVVHVVFEQVDRDRIGCGLDGRDLREDVDAVVTLRDHALQAADLALDAAQAREVVLGVAVVAVLGAHANESTPRGYICQGCVSFMGSHPLAPNSQPP